MLLLKRNPLGFSADFWGTGLHFLPSLYSPQLFSAEHCEQFFAVPSLTGQELLTLEQAPIRGGAQTDWTDLSKVLLEPWLLATWRAPNPKPWADQSSGKGAQAPAINS